ncbi:MAG: lysophospholipid acyltransferase family protein [Candidatus Omnitrophica bacterium]|nr:lysophospholipid acyltransferase family protein [Candidatus Omnitrophota bacterium]
MRILKIAFLNFFFYTFFIIFSLIVFVNLGSLIILLALFLPKRRIFKFLRQAIRWYGAVIIRILPFPLIRLDYKNYGLNDPPGPYLFICNHRAASDPFLMAVFPYEIVQVVNIWPFRLPALGIIAKIAGYLSVREMPYTEFAAKTRKLIAEGVSIAVFPEGTRSRDKSVGQFHSAIFRTALETHAAIVPVCITGNENVPPIESAFLRPGIIKIHRLPALTWNEYGAFNAFKLKNYVRDMVAKEVLMMDKTN